MSSKLGFLLSLLFLVPVLAYMGDLYSLQLIHADLDAVALQAGYQISRSNGLTSAIEDYVKESSGASIKALSSEAYFGAEYKFVVYKDYAPLIIQSQTMVVSVTREAILGYQQ
ncbi:MAG: hypothetical protein LKG11_00550 [Bacilli bacterium]|jgi:hypothetical protein|nr:hypothetical protein [Bacilli bacterium]